MEKQVYAVGDRVEKLCEVCGEERGHVVTSVNQRGMISRVSCPKCGTRSTYKNKSEDAKVRATAKSGAPYHPKRIYRAGQTMMHPVYGMIKPPKAAKNSHHVVPNPNGGWSVKKGDASRASKHFDNKEDAIAWGESISEREGTEFVVHGRDGTIERRVS